MPFIQSAPDALPYVDPQPSAETMTSARTLIQAEMDADYQTTLHASIPAMREPAFSDLVANEHLSLAAGEPRVAGIDLSRYEALDAPERGDPGAWKSTLQQAYRSAEYLRGREVNLSLLETYGKNAWLVGNSQLEDVLRSLEREVEGAKLEQEAVEQARRAAQGSVAGEMDSLDETWRAGIGRMIETQAASERLRLEVLERKRKGAA